MNFLVESKIEDKMFEKIKPMPSSSPEKEEQRKKLQEARELKQKQDELEAVSKEILKLRAEGKSMLIGADNLEKLQLLYPDLKRYVGRWNKIAYYSSAVNSIVNNCDIRYNCGCCLDSSLELWPFFETESGKIYSEPPKFWIGNKEGYYGGDIPDPGWKEKLKVAQISESIIQKVEKYFEDNKPNYDEEYLAEEDLTEDNNKY